jgi:hypothetical protein
MNALPSMISVALADGRLARVTVPQPGPATSHAYWLIRTSSAPSSLHELMECRDAPPQKTDGGSHLVLRLRQRRPDVVRRGPPLPKSSNYLPREFGMTVRPNHLAANPTIDSDRVPAST